MATQIGFYLTQDEGDGMRRGNRKNIADYQKSELAQCYGLNVLCRVIPLVVCIEWVMMMMMMMRYQN